MSSTVPGAGKGIALTGWLREVCIVTRWTTSVLRTDGRKAGGGVAGMTLVRTVLAGLVGEVATSQSTNAPSAISSTPIPSHRLVGRSDQPVGEQLRQP